MPTPTSGYAIEIRNIGGIGIFKLYKSSGNKYRISVKQYTGATDSTSYCSIGRIPNRSGGSSREQISSHLHPIADTRWSNR